MNAETKLISVIEITERLTGLLTDEVDLLSQMKVRDIEPLQDAKRRLTEAYQARVKEIQENKEQFKNVSPTLKERLARASQNFKDAIMHDINAVNSARHVNRKIVEAIAEAVRDQQERIKGYDQTGVIQKARKSPYEMTSTTLNEQL